MEDRKENMTALSEEELEKVSGGHGFKVLIHAMDDDGNALPETEAVIKAGATKKKKLI